MYLKFENLLSKMKHDNYDSILDNINFRIIDILSKDSSTTFVEIAKQIGISDATVHLRVRRLIAVGITNSELMTAIQDKSKVVLISSIWCII